MLSHSSVLAVPMPHKHIVDRRHHIPKMSFKVGPPRNWGSSGDSRWRGYVVRWINLLSEVETGRAIVDGATDFRLPGLPRK